MLGDVDADSEFDADVPVVIGALDHLDVPLLNVDSDEYADTALVQGEGRAALDGDHSGGLVDRVYAVHDDRGLLAQHVDESEDWDVVNARVVGPEDDDFDGVFT